MIVTNRQYLFSQAVILSLTGFVIGMILEVVILLWFGDFSRAMADRTYLLIQVLGSGLYGGIVFGSTIIYSVEHWGLLRCTLTHYLITLCSFLTANAVLGWMGSGRFLLTFLCFFTAAYMLIWVVKWLRYRETIAEMNGLLEANSHAEERLKYLDRGRQAHSENERLTSLQMSAVNGGVSSPDLQMIKSCVREDPRPGDPGYQNVYERCRADGWQIYEINDGRLAVAESVLPSLAVGDEVLLQRISGYYGWKIEGVIDY